MAPSPKCSRPSKPDFAPLVLENLRTARVPQAHVVGDAQGREHRLVRHGGSSGDGEATRIGASGFAIANYSH